MADSTQERLENLQTHVAPVLPDDSMSEAARKALLNDFIRLLSHEECSRQDADEACVHQMRVALRRMRSVFLLMGRYFKPKSVQQFQQRMQRLARSLGAVRDLDVMIGDLKRFQETLGEEDQRALQQAIDRLTKRRAAARKRLKRYLDKKAHADFVESFIEFLTLPGTGVKPVQPQVPGPIEAKHLLPVILYERLAAVRAYDRFIESADEATLHQLRIEFKRLRYVVSVFQDLLGKAGKDFIEEIKTIQDHLGKLNDAATARRRLEEMAPKLDDSEVAVLQMYIGMLAHEEQHLQESFPEVWRRFNTRAVQKQLANAVSGL